MPARISEPVARDMVRNIITDKYLDIIDECTGYSELAANDYIALISLIHNIGETAFRSSKLVKLIRNGDLDAKQIKEEFMKWSYVGTRRLEGLAKRREAESKLWED